MGRFAHRLDSRGVCLLHLLSLPTCKAVACYSQTHGDMEEVLMSDFFLCVIALLMVPQTVFILEISGKVNDIFLEMERNRIEREK